MDVAAGCRAGEEQNDQYTCPTGPRLCNKRRAFGVQFTACTVQTSVAFFLPVVCVAVISPDAFIRFAVNVCPVGIVNPAFPVINSSAIIVFVRKVPLQVRVSPIGIVIPAFAVINPEAFILFAVINPSVISVCPAETVNPAFAVINPDDVIVFVDIEVPVVNAFAVSVVSAVVGFQFVLIEIREDASSNCAEL